MRSWLRVATTGMCVSAVSLWAAGEPAFAAGHSPSGGQHGGGGHVKVQITDPGNQISGAGDSVQLQTQASDSNGGSLSYSATGLPGGLSIDSTGLISGTPTGAAQSSAQVTAVDTNGGASATTTFTWTVNAAYDISYPQCGTTLPPPAEASIIGVNDGIVYSANPCLRNEASWGTSHGLQLYANTADPGQAYSSYWPTGQTTPKTCTTTDPNSAECSYDYGYNAALNSFQDAQDALGTTINPATVTWWLDVETGNSWETLETAYGQTAHSQANDTAALQGEVAGLQSKKVTEVGFYSTSHQWDQITGGTGSTFRTNQAWLAGYSTQQQAQTGCGDAAFMGGTVTYTQYPSGGIDADFPC